MSYSFRASSGYSPQISADLSIHGEVFKLAAMGPDCVTIQDARTMPPGQATIRMLVDHKLTIYHVELANGIDPNIYDQPARFLPVDEEALA